MASLADIQALVSTLCAPIGAVCEVCAVRADGDSEALERDAASGLRGAELQRFHALRSPKRRAEYYSGRVAARRLLARQPFRLVPQAYEIDRLPSGAPSLRFTGLPESPAFRSSPRLSISHCEGFAVAVAGCRAVGIDLERVEARPEAFVRHFFSNRERAALRALATERSTEWVNLLWTRKEAVSKVIGWGSRIAFRDLDCSTGSICLADHSIRCNSSSYRGFAASLAFEGS